MRAAYMWAGIVLILAALVAVLALIGFVAAVVTMPARRIRFLLRQRRYWRQHPYGPLPDWTEHERRADGR